MIYPIPDGSLREDQMSSAPQSAEIGGQLMTGQVALPDNTGPSPLLRPATATNTHGVVPPETHMNNHITTTATNQVLESVSVLILVIYLTH